MGYLLALPAILGFLVFYGLPFVLAVWNSFTLGAGGTLFIGLENYRRIWGNTLFQLAAGNTALFMGTGIPAILVLSLLFALLLHKKFKGSRFVKLAFLFPMVVPAAATVMTLRIYLNGRTPGMALLVILYIWKNIGFDIVLLLAGLTMIPGEYYESARLDGAGWWQSFRYITLPLLLPMLFLTFIISVLNAFKSFREAFLLAGEQPADNIYMLQHFMNSNFQNINYPRLCVAAISCFLVIFVILAVMYGGWRLKEKGGGRNE